MLLQGGAFARQVNVIYDVDYQLSVGQIEYHSLTSHGTGNG